MNVYQNSMNKPFIKVKYEANACNMSTSYTALLALFPANL